jgi:hypothetical protein
MNRLLLSRDRLVNAAAAFFPFSLYGNRLVIESRCIFVPNHGMELSCRSWKCNGKPEFNTLKLCMYEKLLLGGFLLAVVCNFSSYIQNFYVHLLHFVVDVVLLVDIV